MQQDVLNIFCPNCGAPANFDIVHQLYQCGHCGGQVTIEEAAQAKKQFQEALSKRVQDTAHSYELETAHCAGCGAEVVFAKSEAMAKCDFCGRSLVRKEYVVSADAPQSVIPFALTKKEAVQRLEEWCQKNSGKEEAKLLPKYFKDIQAYYLPYRLVRGFSHSLVTPQSSTEKFPVEGYLTNTFVNCSDKLDNNLLDAMEPFDLKGLKEFDFAYVAGHKVKVEDIDEKRILFRAGIETSENYRSQLEKIFTTKALFIKTEVEPVVNLPVLLPVYYICNNEINAAVNGQTGKISIRALKESSYIDLPWWVGGLGTFLLAMGIIYLVLSYVTGDSDGTLGLMAMVGMVFLLIFIAMFEPTDKYHKTIVKLKEVFTSGDATFRREGSRLVPSDEVVKRETAEPVCVMDIDGVKTPVIYKFRSVAQISKMIFVTLIGIFLPAILALPFVGFDPTKLHLGGAAVWFVIVAVLAPVLFVQIGLKSLMSDPWVYIKDEKGNLKRHRTFEITLKDITKFVNEFVFSSLGCFTVPILLVILFMVYLTAVGFD